jgi:hypothetical protein
MAPAFDLASVCPRLALARRQRIVELVEERHARHLARWDLQHAEWLVAHRDLQLVRAGATGRRAYIEIRERKLAAAREQLARVRARAERLGAVA